MEKMLGQSMDITAVIFIVTMVVSTVSSLQCYKCEYNHITSSHFALKPILGLLSKVSDDHCKMERPDDAGYILVRNCPQPQADQEVKCAKIAGTVKSSFLSMGFHYTTIARDCVISARDDPDYSYGCHQKLPSSGTGRTILSHIFQGLNIGDINFNGTACYFGDHETSSSSTLRPLVWFLLAISGLLIVQFVGE